MPQLPLSTVTQSFSFRSPDAPSLLDVRAAMLALTSQLRLHALDDAMMSSVEIAVTEVLNNIIEHALSGQDKDWFRLSCEIGSHGVDFHISDNGSPMPLYQLPDAPPPDIQAPRDTLPEGGWGWSLVRTLTTNLAYQRLSNGQVDATNNVHFCIPQATT